MSKSGKNEKRITEMPGFLMGFHNFNSVSKTKHSNNAIHFTFKEHFGYF